MMMENPFRPKRTLADRIPTPGRNKGFVAQVRKRATGRSGPNVSPRLAFIAGAGVMGLAAVSGKVVRVPLAKAGKVVTKRTAKKAADQPKGALKEASSAAT
jgi:hypothetical protein